MAIKEKVFKFAKETGEKIVGRGPEVRFRNLAEKYAKDHGVSEEVAQKEIFSKYLTEFGRETTILGGIDYESPKWRDMTAAMNESFDPPDLERFKVDAENPVIFRAATPVVNAADRGKSGNYFRSKFDNKAPHPLVLEDVALNTKMMGQMLSRVNGDLAPLLANPDALKAICAARPELGADLGKMLAVKKMLEKHERVFGKQLNFDKALDTFKKDTREALGNMIWSAPVEWLGKMMKGSFNFNFNSFVSMFESTVRFLGKEVGSGAKILVRGAQLAGSYAKKTTG